jgi:hypothetical protein
MLEIHPFLKSSSVISLLPPQYISLKEKLKGADKYGISMWMKRNLDALDIIARKQYIENQKLIINEKLVNGEFIPQDYFEECEDNFLEPVEELIKQGKLPRFIKHYDIISKPIKTQVQEFADLPDSFHVVGFGEQLQSERMEVQTDMLKNWVTETIENRFKRFLQEQNIDENQQFNSEEEKQQFIQQIESLRQSKTPKEIGEYMKSDYKHIAVMWAEYELQNQKQKFQLDKLRRLEFEDLLVHARRFRHLRVDKYGFNIETLNPINVFYHKGSQTQYVQDGEYAGTIYLAPVSYVIDKFSKYMTAEQIESYNSNFDSNWNVKSTTDWFSNPVNYSDTNGIPYDTWLPSFDPFINNIAPHLGFNYTPNLFSIGTNNFTGNINQMMVVTETYWKSAEQVFTLSWINPESGLHEVVEVDESFVFPPYIKIQKDKIIDESQEINTAILSYKPQVWGGVIIRGANYASNIQPLYINCGPLEYQRTSPFKINVKLPIVGQIINNRNTKPSSQVDKFKPFQFLVNVAMNKAAKLQERSLMPMIVMDMNLIPNQKDWGGEDALIKWIVAGQEGSVVPVDTSPSNLLGRQDGGQYPRILDVDLTPRITAQLQIARELTMMAYDQLGLTPSRLGDVKGIDTATGLNTSVAKSYQATGSWFTEFWECERVILQQQLDMIQWLKANDKDISVEFVNSDFTTGFLKFANNNFNLYDLQIYVSNSQEELRKKKMYEQLAISNNTVITDMSTRMEMIDSLTPSERILQIVKSAEERGYQQQEKLQQMKQQEIEANTQSEKDRLKQEYELEYAKMKNEEKIAWIKSRGYISEGEQDLDKSGIPDAFEYEKFTTQAGLQYQSLGLNRDKFSLEREKESQRIREKQAELNIKQQELALKNKQIEQTAENVKYLDKGVKK